MNETELRQWLRDILGVIRQGCTLTPTLIDENVVDMVLRAVDNDLIWSWIFRLIGGLVNDEPEPLMAAEPSAACEVAMVNPLLVIAVVRALIALWKAFKSE